MGNSASGGRRNNRISAQSSLFANSPPPRMFSAPSGYPTGHAPPPPAGPGYFVPPASHYQYPPPPYSNSAIPGPQYYTPNFIQTNGHYMMNPHSPQMYRQPSGMPPPPPLAHLRANTIQNDVNLKKATLRLEQDEENPGSYLVAFSFDATVDGSICIFFLAKEGANCCLTPLKPDAFMPVRAEFEKGLGQKFRQATGTGCNLSKFDEGELMKGGEDNVFPFVIRMETVPKSPPADVPPRDSLPLGAPLPNWVHSQITQAVIEKKEDDIYQVRVVKQIIWVAGVRYELQEIYGIENSGSGGNFDGTDSGKECVVCMSEPRDTTVLPCRHMCMCSECAKVLRFQNNRCPICRTPVDQLLEIKVPKTGAENGGAIESSSSQSTATSSSESVDEAGKNAELSNPKSTVGQVSEETSSS